MFTVETNVGVNFDANHLAICWDHGWVISFICSGVLQRIPVDAIKKIRFAEVGADYCNECDGPVPERGLGMGNWLII